MKVKVNIGSGIWCEFEDADGKESLFKAINMVGNWCHECQEVKKRFRFLTNRTDDDIVYIKRICDDCKATSTLGTYKGDKGYFWKKFEKYQKENSGQTKPQKPATDDVPLPTDDDIPF